MKTLRIAMAGAAMALLISLVPAGCGLFDGDGAGGSTSTGVSAPSSTTASQTTVTSPPATAEPTTVPAPSTSARPSTTVRPSTTAPPTTEPSTTLPSSPPTTVRPGTNYTAVPTKDKVVALTFDAAYDPAPLKGILAALEEAGADATFFLTGEFVRDFPSYTKLIIDAGYPIGNHSYSHPDFTELSNDKMRNELQKTASALVDAGAGDPRPLFRPPYGAYNKRVLSVLAGEGYVSVYWTIDTLDWKTDRTPEQIRSVVLKNLKPGAIILMHVGSKQEVEVLPGLLEEIKARGYRFVNLRDALPEAKDGG